MTQGADQASASDVDSILETVQRAGDGAADEKGALAARRTRAAQPDVMQALAALASGSPDEQHLRAGLRAAGVTQKALDAGVKWHRAQQPKPSRRRSGGGAPPPGEEDDRPPVRCGPALHANVATALEALEADPDLYARGGALVRVTREPGGPPIIREHTVATLRVRLARFARFLKWDGRAEDWVPCLPPDPVTKGILEANEWPTGIRMLDGILEMPSLRPDGSAIRDPGYDAPTKCLYLPTTTFFDFPNDPTIEQSQEALRFLWVETSYDFPARGMGYAPGGAAESDPDGILRYTTARNFPDAWGVVSGILTIPARPAIDGDVPAHVSDASSPGSGKGLQVDLVCLATSGRVPEKLTWPSAERGETDAEVGKMLGGEILSGSPIIVWDEVTGAFGGPAINNVLTCGGRAKVRILGESSNPPRKYKAVMFATGNNISCRDNTHRRIIMTHLESPDEHPENHAGWRHVEPTIRTWVREHRAELVAAALTVLRGYICAGCPPVAMPDKSGEMMPEWGGGFEAWSRLVPRAIVWAGGGNILGCRPTADPESRNEERDTMAVVLDAIARLEPRDETSKQPTGEGITVGSIVDRLYTRERLRGEAAPDGYDDAREAIDSLTGNPPGKKPAGKRLGEKLKLWARRPIDGRMIDRSRKKDRANVQRWRVVSPHQAEAQAPVPAEVA